MQPKFVEDYYLSRKQRIFKVASYQKLTRGFQNILGNAKTGDIASKGTVGYCYLYGIGTPQNTAEAVFWLRQALIGILNTKDVNKSLLLKRSPISNYLKKIARGKRGGNVGDRLVAQITLYEAYQFTGANEQKRIEKWRHWISEHNDPICQQFSEQLELLNQWDDEFISTLDLGTKSIYIQLLDRLAFACFDPQLQIRRKSMLTKLKVPDHKIIPIEKKADDQDPLSIINIPPVYNPREISPVKDDYYDDRVGAFFEGEQSIDDSVPDDDPSPGSVVTTAQPGYRGKKSEAVQPGSISFQRKMRENHPAASFINGLTKTQQHKESIGDNKLVPRQLNVRVLKN